MVHLVKLFFSLAPQIKAEDGVPLSGVLLSLSGANFRSNMLTQDTGLLTFNNLVLSSQRISYCGHLLDVLNTFVLLIYLNLFYNLPHVVANLFEFVQWDTKEV